MVDWKYHYGNFEALGSQGVARSIHRHNELQVFCVNSRKQ